VDLDRNVTNRLLYQNILTVDQFDIATLEYLFCLTDSMKQLKGSKTCTLLQGKVLGNLFFEASTRSRMSFASAFMYLGGQVNSTTGVTFSSISKGESLVDTLSVIPLFCDILVIRHPKVGVAAQAAEYSTVPVINSGDGHGEHPTQALLDLYTIHKEKKSVEGLTISMIGDLRFGRTVHSLVKLLCLYQNIRLIFAAPEIVQLPQPLLETVKKCGFDVDVTDDFDYAISQADVIYSTRIQKERFDDQNEFKSVENCYILDKDTVEKRCKRDVSIMHPLPNAAYFRQAENGLYVRMALFLSILDTDGILYSNLHELL
jgi:aspartate carbamoyltransferase catalytic subunit